MVIVVILFALFGKFCGIREKCEEWVIVVVVERGICHHEFVKHIKDRCCGEGGGARLVVVVLVVVVVTVIAGVNVVVMRTPRNVISKELWGVKWVLRGL